jgi:hypothetical protein
MPRRKFVACLALFTLFTMLSSARSDVPDCDGTEAYTQYCPLETKSCANCTLPCTQSDCYGNSRNPWQGLFGCRAKPNPNFTSKTTKCVVILQDPPPGGGPPALVQSDCMTVNSCEVDQNGNCRVNVDNSYTLKANLYETLTSPDGCNEVNLNQ